MYSAPTRVGAWEADLAARDAAAADFSAARAGDRLLYVRRARERAFGNAPVARSWRSDGSLRLGDRVALRSNSGDAALAIDVFDSPWPGCVRVVAAAPSAAGDSGASPAGTARVPAQARAVFVLEAPGGGAGAGLGALVRFGDRVALASHPSLTIDAATRTAGLPFLLCVAAARTTPLSLPRCACARAHGAHPVCKAARFFPPDAASRRLPIA